MKRWILIGLFTLTGCQCRDTSGEIATRALKHCENVPTLDGQQAYCIEGTIQQDCIINNWDARICGELERR